jgi:hypothetical protein
MNADRSERPVSVKSCPFNLHAKLSSIFASIEDYRNTAAQMSIIAAALLELAADASLQRLFHNLKPAVHALMAAVEGGDHEATESRFMQMYTILHGAGQDYSRDEIQLLRQQSGYGCSAAGLSPLLHAGDFVKPQTISADLGAGNGLQGLLLQRLFPHRKTIQIELSASLIETGRIFQKVLRIAEHSVEWVHADLAEAQLCGIDFIYMYRPARPQGGGIELYRSLASRLGECPGPYVIFSVADCLGQFLDKRFSIFYYDGQLTCFRKDQE